MSEPEQFEVLILGSGEGGKKVAWHMARSGRRTAVVERRWIGGSGPNIACLPSKNEIWSARVAHLARHAAEFGTMISGPVTTDMARVRQRKRDMVEGEIALHIHLYQTTGGELIMGAGRFVAPKTLEVTLNDGGTRVLAGDQVFLDIGTRAAVPSVPGLETARPLTHIEALELDYLPSDLVVLGGGYVGLEMAQAYRRFGSRVTIIETGPQLMTREDPDVADEMQRILSGEGIQILVAAETLNVKADPDKRLASPCARPPVSKRSRAAISWPRQDAFPTPPASGSKRPASSWMAAATFASMSGWRRRRRATGECAGSPQFTHASEDDFRIIRDNLVGRNRSTRDRLVPYCMFTDPPQAHVGLSEAEAKRQAEAAHVAKLPMKAVRRTATKDETLGFMKVFVGASDDRILGFTMIGAEAGEVMTVVQTAMLASLPYPKLRDAVIAHPTMAEGLGPLFSNVPALSAQQRHSRAEADPPV